MVSMTNPRPGNCGASVPDYQQVAVRTDLAHTIMVLQQRETAALISEAFGSYRYLAVRSGV